MSLASVGPTLGLDVSSHPAYVRDPAQDKQGVPSSRISGFLEGGGDRGVKREIYSRVVGESSSVGRSSETASSESSSIGVAGDSEDEDENEDEDGEVQSKVSGGLGSLGSLEDSLPIKRGLSNHFTGKSKSFANLMEVSEMKEIEKAEKPLNKRRRTLLASRLGQIVVKGIVSWPSKKMWCQHVFRSSASSSERESFLTKVFNARYQTHWTKESLNAFSVQHLLLRLSNTPLVKSREIY